MERDAIVHAREDMHRHRVADLCAHAALDLKWIGEALARVRDALETSYVSDLESRVRSVAALVEHGQRDPATCDADAFQRAKEDLDRFSMPLHEASITRTLREHACEGPRVTVGGQAVQGTSEGT